MNIEESVLRALSSAPDNRASVNELVAQLGLNQSLIMAAAVKLKEAGLAEILEREYEELSPGRDWSEKLPERVALEKLGAVLGLTAEIEIARLPELLARPDVRAEVKWLTRKGWFTRERDRLVLTEKGRQALAGTLEPDELVNRELKGRDGVMVPELQQHLAGVDVAAAVGLLRGRDELVRVRRRVVRSLKLTAAGGAAGKERCPH